MEIDNFVKFISNHNINRHKKDAADSAAPFYLVIKLSDYSAALTTVIARRF